MVFENPSGQKVPQTLFPLSFLPVSFKCSFWKATFSGLIAASLHFHFLQLNKHHVKPHRTFWKARGDILVSWVLSFLGKAPGAARTRDLWHIGSWHFLVLWLPFETMFSSKTLSFCFARTFPLKILSLTTIKISKITSAFTFSSVMKLSKAILQNLFVSATQDKFGNPRS